MHRVCDVTEFLARLAPLGLAEEWDNVGLLVGDSDRPVEKVMTCLTLTGDVAREAVERDAQLVVSHHPLLFRPVQRLTAETPEGATILELLAARIAVYSPHTGYDSAREGINQQLAERLGLSEISGLRRPREADNVSPGEAHWESSPGAGRWGRLPSGMSLSELNEYVKVRLNIGRLQYVGDETRVVERVAVACGSAAEFMDDALAAGCQVLLTGEARFHACLEARAVGIALVLVGHYASERPAMERLAEVLAAEFTELTVWPSQSEADPIRWV